MRQAAPPVRRRPSGRADRSPPERRRKVQGRARGSSLRRFLKALGASDRPPRGLLRGRVSRRRDPVRLAPVRGPSVRAARLECEGFGTFPLDRSTPFRIGRSMGSDLVIPFTSVSRRHAVVEWGGDGFHCHDLLSQNGTQVNGKRVPCWRLRAGDEIRIGGVSIRFRERAAALPARGWPSACMVREKAAPGRGRRATLRGDLGKVRLQEIIPFLELHRRDGILEIQWDRDASEGSGDGRGIGRIYFVSGDVIQARTKGASGTEAFFHLIGLARGTFLFREGRPRTARAIREPATALILEALRRIDEAGGS